MENPPIWLNLKAWAAWEQHRKEIKKKQTPLSVKLQLKVLEQDQEHQAEIIKKAIMCGWTGLFPLKDARKPNKYVEPNLDKEMNELRNELIRKFNYKQ